MFVTLAYPTLSQETRDTHYQTNPITESISEHQAHIFQNQIKVTPTRYHFQSALFVIWTNIAFHRISFLSNLSTAKNPHKAGRYKSLSSNISHFTQQNTHHSGFHTVPSPKHQHKLHRTLSVQLNSGIR